MKDAVKIRAYRILKPLRRFYTVDDEHFPAYGRDVELVSEDELIGVYENVPGSQDNAIIVSAYGIYTYQSSVWMFVPYTDILEVSIPEDDKHVADRIELHLTNKRKLTVLVVGGDAKFRDVYEVLRFFDRVIARKRLSTMADE
ncbi:MAG: hypothetical protein KatS3mg053_3874 [Candidatus Roseilinea sp.]|nr:MAG: hypothetical protein KatS3mg053_3874 [Candidatus Roseilinea sp.]